MGRGSYRHTATCSIPIFLINLDIFQERLGAGLSYSLSCTCTSTAAASQGVGQTFAELRAKE